MVNYTFSHKEYKPEYQPDLAVATVDYLGIDDLDSVAFRINIEVKDSKILYHECKFYLRPTHFNGFMFPYKETEIYSDNDLKVVIYAFDDYMELRFQSNTDHLTSMTIDTGALTSSHKRKPEHTKVVLDLFNKLTT